MKKIVAIAILLLLIGQTVNFAFSSNEIIRRQGAASLQKNLEHIAGKLYLMETNLVFESRGINIQSGTTTISLNDIATAETGWSKLLGLIPAVPNALKITMKDGKVYRFACWWPSRWKDAIEEQIKSK
ncbi:MAG: hypothetical protein WCJ71_08750 [Candidatus Omnitrophota bacterium]